ncbi:REP-associated tyrosine transposase [Tropicibacter sp. S64]|uniref:REP-associated tyrosine transposase n=1 Tax=Tropicibacter sp. S64 TaxID=3415122 RepID=UPI003C7D3B08
MVQYRRLRVPGGTVFFTVCLARVGARLLVDEIDTLRWAVGRTLGERPVEVLAWVVLPDRMHAVWRMPEGDSDYSRRWGAIKGRFSLALAGAGQSPALREPRTGDAGIWQKRFWEHHIRGPEDLRVHLEYCRKAPVEARLVTWPEDWPYSSFHKEAGAVQSLPERSIRAS